MEESTAAARPERERNRGWIVLAVVCLVAVLTLSLAIRRAVVNPRTDDAVVFANFIGIAPQVDGPLMKVSVRDNQLVRTGDLLYEIDARPYEYALERALSDQAALEGQIVDTGRRIAAQRTAVDVARADVSGEAAARVAQTANVAQAKADVDNAQASLRRLQADLKYAEDNLNRVEPLLAQQYVTRDEVDRARTLVETRGEAVNEARANLARLEARVQTNAAQEVQSGENVRQAQARTVQASRGVETLEPLTNQREARAAAVRLAQYNLNNCRVYAPFDAVVTNLTISEGAYAHTGQQMFTLIDTRAWWVVANFRETQLKYVQVGAPADVFLMQREGQPLRGVVESIGYGVIPDPTVAGTLAPGLPAVQRSLSWVHLAARYPVRIRVLSPPPDLLRIGETAVAVVHPQTRGR